jgi:hypothetical protein
MGKNCKLAAMWCGRGGVGMVMCDDTRVVILSACRSLPSCLREDDQFVGDGEIKLCLYCSRNKVLLNLDLRFQSVAIDRMNN